MMLLEIVQARLGISSTIFCSQDKPEGSGSIVKIFGENGGVSRRGRRALGTLVALVLLAGGGAEGAEPGASPLRFGGVGLGAPALRGGEGEPKLASGVEIRLVTGDVLVFGTPPAAVRGSGGFPFLDPLTEMGKIPLPGAVRGGAEGSLPALPGMGVTTSAESTGTLPSLGGVGTPPPAMTGTGQLPVLPGGQGTGGQGIGGQGTGGQGGLLGNPLLAAPSPAPLVWGTGGLGALGQTPVADLAVWKTFDLSTAFGLSQFPLGRLEYPGKWLVQVDTFNRTVTFAEDPSGMVCFTIAPGATVQVSSARDLAAQVASLLAANVPDLAVVREEFREDPSFQGSGYALTFGRFLLVGTFQGRAMTAMVQTYVMASQMSGGMPFALGTAVVCTAPRELFDQKLQGVFNRMITSYEASVSKPSKKD